MPIKQRALFSSGLIIAASLLAGQTGAAYAQSSLPSDVPTPLARPFAPTATHESPINLVTPKARPATPTRLSRLPSVVSRTLP